MPKKIPPEKITAPPTRNANATRGRILAAAIELFAIHSYDEVGLREIVSAAGVSLPMVKRYFGSKAGLFAEVIDSIKATSRLHFLDGPRNEVAAQMARLATDIDSDDERRQAHLLSLMVLLRAAHCKSTVTILRDKLEEHELRPLTDWLDGPHSAERAALMEAFVIGLATMQRVVKLDALNKGDMNIVVDFVKAALQMCIDGKPYSSPDEAVVKATRRPASVKLGGKTTRK